MIGEHVIADPSHHPDLRFVGAQFCRGARLIGALATGDHLEIASKHRLPGRGQTIDSHHKIHVEAAYDHDRGHRFRSIPNFFNSSA